MEEEINEWFRGERNYSEGVDLLAKHSNTDVLPFRSDWSGRLRERLEKLLTNLSLTGFSSPSPSSPLPPPATAGNRTIDSPGKMMERLKIKNSGLYKRRAILSNSLYDFPSHDDAGREIVVKQIAEITSEMQENAQLIKRIEKTKEIPPQQPEIRKLPSDTGELFRLRGNLACKASRRRTKMKKLPVGHPGHTKARTELAEIEATIEEINKLLK